MLSDSINFLKNLKGSDDVNLKQLCTTDVLSRVWKLNVPQASKWASLLKRTCEFFGFRSSVVSVGWSGNKSVVKSSLTLLTMIGVSATRD